MYLYFRFDSHQACLFLLLKQFYFHQKFWFFSIDRASIYNDDPRRGRLMKERFFLSSLFIKALFNFHLPDIFIISTYHTSTTTTTTCMEKNNNVIKEMGKNCCNTSVSFFQYTQHKPSLMSISKKPAKKN